MGLSGKDGSLIKARKLYSSRKKARRHGGKVDMGHVGEVKRSTPRSSMLVEKAGFVAVIAPSGVGDDGLTYNINADTVAAGVAGQLGVEKLIILTDEQGVLDKKGNLISSLKYAQIQGLIKKGVVTGGMIPKLECCMRALEKG